MNTLTVKGENSDELSILKEAQGERNVKVGYNCFINHSLFSEWRMELCWLSSLKCIVLVLVPMTWQLCDPMMIGIQGEGTINICRPHSRCVAHRSLFIHQALQKFREHRTKLKAKGPWNSILPCQESTFFSILANVDNTIFKQKLHFVSKWHNDHTWSHLSVGVVVQSKRML